MGIDLTLLPMTADADGSAYGSTTLELDKQRELWPLIRSLHSEPVPPYFETLLSTEGPEEWDACVEGNTQVDNYGNPLMCVLVEQLLSLADHSGVRATYTNRAVWAYLAQLPADMRVALYWW